MLAIGAGRHRVADQVEGVADVVGVADPRQALGPGPNHRLQEPVTRGARMAAFFWVQSMVRDDWRRNMLHELDCNIQSLRQQMGDSAEVLGLTGHYHNLLRQWADV